MGIHQHNYYLRNIDERKQKAMDWQKNNPQRTKEIHDKAVKNQRIRELEKYSQGMMDCKCCHETHIEFLRIDKLGNRLLCYNCYANRKSCPHVTDRKKYIDSLIKTL